MVCTELLGKERHRQVDRVMTSGRLGDVAISTLAQNERDMGSILALTAIFPIFITSMTILMMMTVLISLLVFGVW